MTLNGERGNIEFLKKLGRFAVIAAFLGGVTVTSVAHAESSADNGQGVAYTYAAGGIAAPILSGCVMSGPAMLVCGGIAAGAVLCYMYCDDILNWMMAEHTKNQTPSNRKRHERGQTRQKRDQQGGTQEEGQGRPRGKLA